MADTLYNQSKSIEITKDIIETLRTPSLQQVLNVGLNGLVHIQNIGIVNYQIQVDFIIHKQNDKLIYDAYRDADLIKVIDDNNEYIGYIISVNLDNKHAQGYHKGTIILQEEVVWWEVYPTLF